MVGRRQTCISVLVVTALGACQVKKGAGTGPGGAGPGLLPQDQSFALGDVEVEGTVHAPEAMGLPPMPQLTTRQRVTLDRARRHVARRNPAAEEVHMLVSLVWAEADRVGASDAAAAGALREEGRTALRKLKAAQAARIDATSLEMLAAAEMWMGDQAAATLAYEELIVRFPQHVNAQVFRARLASLYLRQRRLSDATALAVGWRPAEIGDQAAYTLAWIKAAAGDSTAARDAIVQAARSWRDPATRPIVERDLVLLLARGGADVAEGSRVVAEVSVGGVQQRYVLMFKLSEAFKYAGRYAEASQALDVIINDVVKGQLPADDLVSFRYRQADYAFRLNQPDVAAARAIEAHKALASCGDRCAPQTAQAVTERLLKLAQFSHTVYAKSLDTRHHDAAKKLYVYYAAIPGQKDTQVARGYQKSLEDTRASADTNSGKHDKDVLLNMVVSRREALAACYEGVLLRDGAIEGTVAVSLEIDQKGAVTGAATDPAGGAEGLAAAASCAVERMRTWTFPSRTVPGRTVLQASVRFRGAGAAAPPPAAPPAGG